MAIVKLLAGLRRFGGREQRVDGATVRAALAATPVPTGLLFPGGELNGDIEVLVNGRNVAFLERLQPRVADDDRVTVFLHGARGYPGG